MMISIINTHIHMSIRLNRLTSAKKQGFTRRPVYPKREVPLQSLYYLKQKSSFFVATFSLVAFIAGNMLGQHGWHAFWASVLGQYDDSLIEYTGTVPPVAQVPDYERWSLYGSDGKPHAFHDVPEHVLLPLPAYDQRTERLRYEDQPAGDVYSIGNLGSYATGAEGHGSHTGVDIRVPEGTPVRSIANGIVTDVRNDPYGFGLLIVIRHPHMPDPARPSRTTVLHSGYAHLSAQSVRVGDVVTKGQQIGLSGQTGFATGPHLHFQLDRDEAPWHPYWPFSASEAREAGYSTSQAIDAGFHRERAERFTVHPMLYVQRNYAPVQLASADRRTASSARSRKPISRIALIREQRLAAHRLALQSPAVLRSTTVADAAERPAAPLAALSSSSSASARSVATAGPVTTVANTPTTIATIDIQHDRQYEERGWENVRLTLLDERGRTVAGDYLTTKLYLRTAYGDAEFDPPILTAKDFVNGTAVIKMLPRGRRTVVMIIEPFKVMSEPMEYAGR